MYCRGFQGGLVRTCFAQELWIPTRTVSSRKKSFEERERERTRTHKKWSKFQKTIQDKLDRRTTSS